jgi:hypothetical protein
MNRKQVDLLGEYIKAGNAIVLTEMLPNSIVEKGAVVINADCANAELMGHYENFEYVTPQWYIKLVESSKEHTPVLIIKDINKIPEEEQRKFIELFKYKKVYVHKLPENCMIFVTYSDLKENPIDEEVYSFMAHII